MPKSLFPAPTQVLHCLWGGLLSGEIPSQLARTLSRLCLGFSVGGGLGTCLGLACGLHRPLDRLFGPWIDALSPLPKVALIPLLMLFLGTGEYLNAVLISMEVFFQLFIPVRAGIRETDPNLLDAARNLGAGRRQMLRHVLLPSLLPYLLSGARSGLLYGLRAAIVVEALISATGLGRALWLSGDWLRMDVYYAYLLCLALLGIALSQALQFATRRLAPWGKAA